MYKIALSWRIRPGVNRDTTVAHTQIVDFESKGAADDALEALGTQSTSLPYEIIGQRLYKK